MTARNDLDEQLNSFLRDGPDELPYASFDAVRDATEQTRQRAVIGPWRVPTMNRFVTYGLGTAAVVIAGLFLGYQFLGTPGNVGGPGVEPTATPEVTATPEPTPSPVSAPPLTQRFTSTQHGISVSYPEGWNAQAATEPWTESTFPLEFDGAFADWLYDPTLTSSLFLTVASQPIGDSTAADWIAAQMASGEGCPATGPTTVAGASGLIGAGDCDVAVVTSGGRGYWIQLYTSSDDEHAVAPYDRAWFEEVLATVELHPEDAVD